MIRCLFVYFILEISVKCEFPPGIIKLSLSLCVKISHSVSVSTSLALCIGPTLQLFHLTSGLLVIQKLLQVLRSQLAFVQNLFQLEPEALKCQEDEWVQLEVRAKALQQQALEQEVASQRRTQVCSAHMLRAM